MRIKLSYSGSRGIRINTCGHPGRRHIARGMCEACYDTRRRRARGEQQRRPPRINECGHPERKHAGHGMCGPCAFQALKQDPDKYERMLAGSRKYHAEHRDEIAARQKVYKSDPERRAHFNAYHREYMKEYMTRPGKREAERERTKQRAQTEQWRAYQRAYQKEWKQKPENRAKVRDRWHRQNHARRALGDVPPLREIGERVGWICGHAATGGCRARRKRIDPSLPGSHPMGATYEHIIPVSKGGTNDPQNLTVSHRMCNVSHGNRATIQMVLMPTPLGATPWTPSTRPTG